MALAYQRKYPLAAPPLGSFLLAGRMVSGASGAADGRGPRRNLHIDPAAAMALRISPGAIGGLVFVHVPADLVAHARLFEIYRTPIARKLDAVGAVCVGIGLYELFWVGLDGTVGPGSLTANGAGEADVAVAAGDGDISAAGVRSDHAGVHHGVAHRCCDWPYQLAARDGRLQSLLFIRERIGCAMVLGAGDCCGVGDCVRVAAGAHLREGGRSAILFVFRLAAGGDDDSADCYNAADADDQPVVDSFAWDYAGNDDAASRATVAGGLAAFAGRDRLVRNFRAHTLRCAALDRALGSGGARSGAGCRRRRDRDWQ